MVLQSHLAVLLLDLLARVILWWHWFIDPDWRTNHFEPRCFKNLLNPDVIYVYIYIWVVFKVHVLPKWCWNVALLVALFLCQLSSLNGRGLADLQEFVQIFTFEGWASVQSAQTGTDSHTCKFVGRELPLVVLQAAFQQRTQLQSASSSAILFLFVPVRQVQCCLILDN